MGRWGLGWVPGGAGPGSGKSRPSEIAETLTKYVSAYPETGWFRVAMASDSQAT
jgi:hypothetical protein